MSAALSRVMLKRRPRTCAVPNDPPLGSDRDTKVGCVVAWLLLIALVML